MSQLVTDMGRLWSDLGPIKKQARSHYNCRMEFSPLLLRLLPPAHCTVRTSPHLTSSSFLHAICAGFTMKSESEQTWRKSQQNHKEGKVTSHIPVSPYHSTESCPPQQDQPHLHPTPHLTSSSSLHATCLAFPPAGCWVFRRTRAQKSCLSFLFIIRHTGS